MCDHRTVDKLVFIEQYNKLQHLDKTENFEVESLTSWSWDWEQELVAFSGLCLVLVMSVFDLSSVHILQHILMLMARCSLIVLMCC